MASYEYFEGAMLLFFSVSWYFSIYKMLRVRVAVGKSVVFVSLICTGYLCGILAKIGQWAVTGELSLLVWLYAWNLVVAAVDLLLVFHFGHHLAHQAVKEEATRPAETG